MAKITSLYPKGFQWFAHVVEVITLPELTYLDKIFSATTILKLRNSKGFHTIVLEGELFITAKPLQQNQLVRIYEYFGHIVEVTTRDSSLLYWETAPDLQEYPAGWNAKHDTVNCTMEECKYWPHFYEMSEEARRLYLTLRHSDAIGTDGRYHRHPPKLDQGKEMWEASASATHALVFIDIGIYPGFVCLEPGLHHLCQFHALNFRDEEFATFTLDAVRTWAKDTWQLYTYRTAPRFMSSNLVLDGRSISLYDYIVSLGIEF